MATTEEVSQAPADAPGVPGSPSTIPVDQEVLEEIKLLKASQDSLHQSMADKFEELEKENNILKNSVGDLK